MKRLYYKRNPKKFMNFEKQVENCKKVYLVYQGVEGYYYREYPYAGKFAKDEQLGFSPLVYNFDDCNGTDFVYEVMPISEVTTFTPLVYTFDFYTAQSITLGLNNLMTLEEYCKQEDKRVEEKIKEGLKDKLKEQNLTPEGLKSMRAEIKRLTKSCNHWQKMTEKYYKIITGTNEDNIEITELKANDKTNSRIIVKNKNIKGGK